MGSHISAIHLISRQASTLTLGCTVHHEKDLNTTEVSIVIASYSGCGGGMCGKTKQNQVSSIGNRVLTVSKCQIRVARKPAAA